MPTTTQSNAPFKSNDERLAALRDASISDMVTLGRLVKNLGYDADATTLFDAWAAELSNSNKSAAENARVVFDYAMGRQGSPHEKPAQEPATADEAVAKPAVASVDAAEEGGAAVDDDATEEDEPAAPPPARPPAPTKVPADALTVLQPKHTVEGKIPGDLDGVRKAAMFVRAKIDPKALGEPQEVNTRVVLVVDCSESTMYNGAMEATRALLKQLPDVAKKHREGSKAGRLRSVPVIEVLAYGALNSPMGFHASSTWLTTKGPINLLDAKASTLLEHVAFGLHNMGGTDTTGALDKALDHLQATLDPHESAHVIVCTDGRTNVGIKEPEDLEQHISARLRVDSRICIHAIGMGIKVRPDYLETLVKAGVGNGIFTYAPTAQQLGTCINELLKPVMESRGVLQLRVYDDTAYDGGGEGVVRNADGVRCRLLNLGLFYGQNLTTRAFKIVYRQRHFLGPGLDGAGAPTTVAHLELVTGKPPVLDEGTNRPPVAKCELTFLAQSWVPPDAEQVPPAWAELAETEAVQRDFKEYMNRELAEGKLDGDTAKKCKRALDEFIAKAPNPKLARTATQSVGKQIDDAEDVPAYRSCGAQAGDKEGERAGATAWLGSFQFGE